MEFVDVKRVVELYISGISVNNIANMLGVGTKTVSKILRRHGIYAKPKVVVEVECVMCGEMGFLTPLRRGIYVTHIKNGRVTRCYVGDVSTAMRRYPSLRKYFGSILSSATP
ncbi:MAG: hypothetical protein ACK4SY_08745 [Pyrobaculum sp.]